MLESVVEDAVKRFTGFSEMSDEWDRTGLLTYYNDEFAMVPPLEISADEILDYSREKLTEKLTEAAKARYDAKEAECGSEIMREIERVILLRAVDSRWMTHIDDMEQLKHSIGLAAYGQRNPVDEYKFIGFDMFEEMIAAIREDTVKYILRTRVDQKVEREQVAKPLTASRGDGSETAKPQRRSEEKVGRNDPCPCGSGKKYKKCCGMNKD